MENNENLLNNELQVDPVVQGHLSETAKWARFLGMVGFIFSGLVLVSALANFINYSNYSSRDIYFKSRSGAVSPGISIFILLAVAVVWFMTSLFIYRFATKMKVALQNYDQFSFTDAMDNLSRNYKFLGIVTIVYIFLVILGVLAMVLSS